MSSNDPQNLLAAAERRIATLERRLAAKSREVSDIHQSRAWALVAGLRSLKLRVVDPLLALFGIAWPRRRPILGGAPIAIEPASADRYDVVCLSLCEWDARFQRPQQLMSRFAAAGHRVFYVRHELRRDGPPWSAIVKMPNVYEITLREGLQFEGLDALRRDASIGAAAIVVQLPCWWPLARRAREQFGWPVLYDCMDLHAAFTTVRRSMVAHEPEMLAQADVVIASSAFLEARALRHRRDVLLLRNACDFEHFAQTPRAQNARPTIGYYGAISDWFDSTLVAELAARRPDWDFLLIGSTYGGNIARLATLPNVSLIGEEPYESLPDWLGSFDVAIVPFQRTALTEATNPVKVYEILAAGKAIVSVPIPEVAMLAPLVRLASTAEEFEREILAALNEGDEAADQRRAFAREQTWDRRFEALASATAAAVSQRAC